MGHDGEPDPSQDAPLGVDVEATRAAVHYARERRTLAEFVDAQVRMRAVHVLAYGGLSVRQTADRSGIPKSEVNRITRHLPRGDDGRLAPPGPLLPAGHDDEAGYLIRAAWQRPDRVPALGSREARDLLKAAGLDLPASYALAEQLAREVLAVLHPETEVTPGRLMVAMVQVARDPAAAYVIAGYDSTPADAAAACAIRTARTRAAYARADWIDPDQYDHDGGKGPLAVE